GLDRGTDRRRRLPAQHDRHGVTRPIIDQIHPFVCGGGTVDCNGDHSARYAFRIAHADRVDAIAVSIVELEFGPGRRNARIETKAGAHLLEAEYPLQGNAVTPARRARIPRPPATPLVPLGGI